MLTPHFGERVMVIPTAPGSACRPDGAMVPDAGCAVLYSPWWARRLQEGAVALAEDKKDATPKRKE